MTFANKKKSTKNFCKLQEKTTCKKGNSNIKKQDKKRDFFEKMNIINCMIINEESKSSNTKQSNNPTVNSCKTLNWKQLVKLFQIKTQNQGRLSLNQKQKIYTVIEWFIQTRQNFELSFSLKEFCSLYNGNVLEDSLQTSQTSQKNFDE